MVSTVILFFSTNYYDDTYVLYVSNFGFLISELSGSVYRSVHRTGGYLSLVLIGHAWSTSLASNSSITRWFSLRYVLGRVYMQYHTYWTGLCPDY